MIIIIIIIIIIIDVMPMLFTIFLFVDDCFSSYTCVNLFPPVS
jgi:hypothetical protein